MRGITFFSILLLFLLLLSGCASVVSREHLDPEERWRYEIRLTRKGTAREGEWGRLAYRGREIPSWFSTIVIGGRQFEYLLRKEPNDFLGYHLDDDSPPGEARALPEVPSSGSNALEPVGERELDRGWYWAGFANRKPGTPENWVWIMRENLSAWVDPAELNDFADAYELGTILRQEERPQSGLNLGLSFVTVF